jgi:hypothetical protein
MCPASGGEDGYSRAGCPGTTGLPAPGRSRPHGVVCARNGLRSGVAGNRSLGSGGGHRGGAGWLDIRRRGGQVFPGRPRAGPPGPRGARGARPRGAAALEEASREGRGGGHRPPGAGQAVGCLPGPVAAVLARATERVLGALPSAITGPGGEAVEKMLRLGTVTVGTLPASVLPPMLAELQEHLGVDGGLADAVTSAEPSRGSSPSGRRGGLRFTRSPGGPARRRWRRPPGCPHQP